MADAESRDAILAALVAEGLVAITGNEITAPAVRRLLAAPPPPLIWRNARTTLARRPPVAGISRLNHFQTNTTPTMMIYATTRRRQLDRVGEST